MGSKARFALHKTTFATRYITGKSFNWNLFSIIKRFFFIFSLTLLIDHLQSGKLASFHLKDKNMHLITQTKILLTLCLVHASIIFGVPVITSVTPNAGTAGAALTITGSGFTGATSVNFDGTTALFVVNNDNSITATSPAHVAGTVDITVTAPSGTSAITPNDRFTYQDDWFAYVADGSTGLINIFDLSTDTAAGSFSPGSSPYYIALTPDGSRAFFTNNGSGNVTVLDIPSGTVQTIVIGDTPREVAITPDGTKVYISTVSGSLAVIQNSAVPTLLTVLPLSTRCLGLAITPDGKKVYVNNYVAGTISVVDTATDTLINTIAVGVTNFGIAMRPDGTRAYFTKELGTVGVLDLSNDTVIATITIPPPSPSFPYGIAVAPDGAKAYVVASNTTRLYPIDLSTNTLLSPIIYAGSGAGISVAITPDSLKAVIVDLINGVYFVDLVTSAVTFIPSAGVPTGVAITPDQAPAASFVVVTPGQATISPTSFDASSSVSPTGTIVSYFWDFGDGNSTTTAIPTVSHQYGVGGFMTVTLTVTNSAGTSTTQVFNGQTMNKNGGPDATFALQVNVGQPPFIAGPGNFVGKVIKNVFLTQTEIIHQLRWSPSPDPFVAAYLLYRNGKLIAIIPPNGPYVYDDHNRGNCHHHDTYTLIAISEFNVTSIPISIVL